jgi:uncharacterized protein (TIGR03032 family)
MTTRKRNPRPLWSRQDAAWRDPVQVASLWEHAGDTDPRLLRYRTRGDWWEILAALRIVLIVSREYEHLLIAISAPPEGPEVSYWPLPHPSGLALDEKRGTLHVASTRSPNQIFDFAPATRLISRRDVKGLRLEGRPLLPVRSRFFPGCLYLHDLAMVGGALHGCAVGQNAVVRLDPSGAYERVWWPRCVESGSRPVFGLNHIQLNSIAAGRTLRASFFTASSDRIDARRPGHRDYPVDRRGVLFSGATREPVARGLTRPHSARFHGGRVWLDDSGYGDFGFVEGGRLVSVARMPGWTRGLAFCGNVAFVGTSRVLPRFRRYAPGLDQSASVCGVHAVDTRSGRVLGSLIWPFGNQIFGIEHAPRRFTSGFPLPVGRPRALARIRKLFYSFSCEVRV